jgi:hypothetical protein
MAELLQFSMTTDHYKKTVFMKKLLGLVILIYATSCSNPEDKATGNPDSTSFNQSSNDKNLNTATDDPDNQSNVNNNDTSASPATSKENANSKKDGTNRSYKAGGDSSQKK